jgi:hypothetical protein
MVEEYIAAEETLVDDIELSGHEAVFFDEQYAHPTNGML